MSNPVKRTFGRVKQQLDQTVGRSERTSVLSQDLERCERDVIAAEKALEAVREKLATCIRSKSSAHADNVERRKMKLCEAVLAETALKESDLLMGTRDSERLLLRDTMFLYGEAMSNISSEIVRCDMEVESRVIERMTRYAEEGKRVKQLRDKLGRLTLDMDAARNRRESASMEKSHMAQDEFDSALQKVEACKDQFATEVHSLLSREIELSALFEVLLKIQLEYHQTAVAELQEALPRLVSLIATNPNRPVFGCPLEDTIRFSGRRIAPVIESCCAALNELGFEEEGLFRVSGNKARIARLKATFDSGHAVDFAELAHDPHSIAGCLKLYLRELPDPLATSQLNRAWSDATANHQGGERVAALREVVERLPEANRENLRYLIKFLSALCSHHQINKMTASNLAIVIGPSIFGYSTADGSAGLESSAVGGTICEALITNADDIFPGMAERFSSAFIGSLVDTTGGFNNAHRTAPLHVAQANGVGPAAASPTPAPKLSPKPQIGVNPSNGGGGSLKAQRPKAPAPPPPPSDRRTMTTSMIILDDSSSDGALYDAVNEIGIGFENIQNTEQSGAPQHGHRKTNSLDQIGPPPQPGFSPQLMETPPAVPRTNRPPQPSKEQLQRNAEYRRSLSEKSNSSGAEGDSKPVAAPRRTTKPPPPLPEKPAISEEAAAVDTSHVYMELEAEPELREQSTLETQTSQDSVVASRKSMFEAALQPVPLGPQPNSAKSPIDPSKITRL